MTRRPWPWLLGLGALSGACTGVIGEGPPNGAGQGPGSTPTSFVCDDDQVPEAVPLRRLSHLQYTNTITDLVRFASPSAADTILSEAAPFFSQLPDDQRVGPDKHYAGFSRLDQALQQQHVDGAYSVAETIGAALTSSPARLAELAGACATDADAANDDACLDAMIRKFGERALRKAVTDEDVAFYRGPAGAAPFDAADYADVVALLLNAPHMLYFVEHGQESGKDPTAPLDAYEIASRLSYHFWQTLPDDKLFAAAKSGDLLTEAGYAAEVDRIFNDPRTRGAMGELFGQWLDNTTLEELDARVGTPLFDAFSAGYTPGPDLREHMLAEVTDAALYYTFESPGTFRDLLTSRKSFARTDDLAALYNTPAWTGSEPPDFTEPERVGLLTRAAYLSTGSANTRPIMKGVFIRKALLCDEIPPPPPNAAANPPQLSDTLSTRQVVEELTGNGVCNTCHGVSINALGFATENFDSLGRVRTEQTLFDPDTGDVVGTAKINTAAVPRIELSDEQVAENAGELTNLIAASNKPYACFARQYFRFTFGRLEDIERDSCALADVKLALDEGKPMADVLRAIAQSKAFRVRSFDE